MDQKERVDEDWGVLVFGLGLQSGSLCYIALRSVER